MNLSSEAHNRPETICVSVGSAHITVAPSDPIQMYKEFLDSDYRIFGLHGVIGKQCNCGWEDCTALFKHPVARNWQHTPDWSEEQLETMELMGQLDTGYGVLVSGMLVVDVDARNGGVESYERLLEAIPEIAGAGLIVNTGSGKGSKHLFFSAPKMALLQNHPEYEGIDFKSSGFVVGAGSMHKSGNRYEAVVGTPADIGEAPAALLALLEKPEVHRTEYNGEQIDVSDDQIAEMLSKINNDDVDYEIFIRIGMAVHNCTGGSAFHLWDEWASRSSKYDRRVMDMKWQSFGKSANPVTLGTLAHYAEEGGYTESVTFVSEIIWDHVEDELSPLLKTSKNGAIDPSDDPWVEALMTDDYTEILRIANLPMLIEGVLPVGALGFLFGESGGGKSFVMVDAACSISTGEPWLGRNTPDEGGLVIYVAAEGANGLRIRKRGWEQERGTQAKNMLILPEAVMMDDKMQVGRLINCIKTVCKRRNNSHPNLIILDTFARSMRGDENSNTDAAAFIRGCESVRHAFGCAVVAVHHSGHKDKGRMRGASANHAAADCVIKLEPKDTGVVKLTCAKSKDIEPFDPIELKMEKIALKGINRADGEPISTLVVRETSSSDRVVLTADERLIITTLQASSSATKLDLQTTFANANQNKKPDTVKRLFRRALASLKKKKSIEVDESECFYLPCDFFH
jgi:hypothetical protein